MLQLRYVGKNRRYQKVLDLVYHGKIVPIERYQTPKMVIKHYCLKCDTLFYARPSSLLNDPNQRHDCNSKRYEILLKEIAFENSKVPPKPQKRSVKESEVNVTKPKVKPKIAPEVIEKILELHRQGISNRQIAIKLGINHKTVARHIKRNGASNIYHLHWK